jgi:membrane-bound lytic murein transglycosylase D
LTNGVMILLNLDSMSMNGKVFAGLTLLGLAGLTGCATTQPAPKFRTFLIPPVEARALALDPEPLPEPPQLDLYADEIPALQVAAPPISRPTETEFLLRRADDRFAAGKRALQDGEFPQARNEFNRAVELLLTAPADLPERARVQRRLDELVDSIYRYDQDQLGATDDEVTYEKRPLDDLLEMTFPIDPSLRGKVREQIQMTTSDLPLEESDAVISYINFFSSPRGRRILIAGLERSGRYKDMIQRVLADEGVPEELIFLAQAESGFLPRALSPAKGCGTGGCAGMWQFAAFRGKEYGLLQTSATDDRLDPEKATRAAAHHLRDLYNHFGDWYLAMAAYNCGPGCVDSAVLKTGYADFWELRRKNALPSETANYVPAILAMTIMSKNAKEYGIGEIDYAPPMQYDSLELQTPTHLGLVAAAVDRSIGELKELNPGLLKTVAPAGYNLRIPKGSLQQLEAMLQAVPADRRDSWRVHRVEPGDTFAGVAKEYGTTTALLSSANHDELPETGEFAIVPVAYPGERPAAAPKKVSKTGAKKAAAKPAATKTAAKKAAPKKSASKAKASAAGKSTKSPVRRAAGA